MRHRLFITGTDTDVGKTQITAAILQLAKQQGLSTAALKPIAAGCDEIRHADGKTELHNADALLLQKLSTLPLSYSEVNPIALKQAMAPHLAAYAENRNITVERLIGLTQGVFNKKADLTVIEGAGGWRVPLSHRELYSQYVQQLNLLQTKTPVLLVAGIRLGCINHTLLTVEAIANDKVPLVGWIANCIDKNMLAIIENIQTLERLLPAPCLGVIPFEENPVPEKFSEKINFDLLIKQLDNF